MNEISRVETRLLGGKDNWRGLKYVVPGTKIHREVLDANGNSIKVEKTVNTILRDDNNVHIVVFEPCDIPGDED